MHDVDLLTSDSASAAASESSPLLIGHKTIPRNDRSILPPPPPLPHSGTTRRKTSRLQSQRSRLKHLKDALTSTERTDATGEDGDPAAALNRTASIAADDEDDDDDNEEEKKEEEIEIQKSRRGNADVGRLSTGKPSTVSSASQTEECFVPGSTRTPTTMSASSQTDPDRVAVGPNRPTLSSCEVIDKATARLPQPTAAPPTEDCDDVTRRHPLLRAATSDPIFDSFLDESIFCFIRMKRSIRQFRTLDNISLTEQND